MGLGHDDPELVRRWLSGEAAAFDALVRRWQQPAARYFARMLGPAAPVADLCQELFLRVHLSRGRYREEGRFATWLYRIAQNLARDHLRRQARRPALLPDGEEPAADGPDWDRGEAREGIDLALARLPAPLREVLVLRHYQGLNFEEMGRLLGTPPTTLKSRFAVALKQMQAALLTLGWGEEEAVP
jgi:RNA polymerase sigma factor (sigma-70 family)